MKDNLIELIDRIDEVSQKFHSTASSGFVGSNIIYDVNEFVAWKKQVQHELQEIFDRTKNQYIRELLENIKQGYNGYSDDEINFNNLRGGLLAIQKNIDKYYSVNNSSLSMEADAISKQPKNKKIFISHAGADKSYALAFVELLEKIGLSREHIFCSSVPGYGIALNKDIYEQLLDEFQNYDLHVIYMLSKSYYDSAACLNEMGAAWVLRKDYTMILLPGFEFSKIEGAVNPTQIGIKLDNDTSDVKSRLRELKENLSSEFELKNISPEQWERYIDDFLKKIHEYMGT